MMFNAQRGRGRGSVFGSPHDSVQQQPIQFFQTSTFQTPNNSAFQKPNNQASVFSTSNHSAFQASNHQASAFQPPTQSAFQPPTQSAFQPSTASTFQASNNASSRFAFQQQQQPSSAFRAPKNNTKRNQFDASLNEALGQSNPSSFSLGQPEKPRFEPKKKTKQKPMEPMLDESRVTAADRAQRFGATNKSAEYDRMKKSRVHERQQAIDRGLIPDPNAPVRLEDAIDFRGTCETKCPDFEILEREIQNGLDSLEMDAYGNADKHKVVKAYRRSAAGNEQPLPSDVRTPESLVSTLDYLVDEVLSQQPLEKCHAFIRDRTRSIRQDFTLQNIRDITAVQVHERIARFHILCLHEMCGLDESKFSEQQETEQLRKVLLSLMEFYDDLREEGIETTNEPEFRAYYMLSHIRDQDIARQAQTLPMHVFKHPYITRALDFFGLVQRNNEIMETSSRRNKPENVEASQNFYSRFFKLIQDSQTTFLMGCMLESHFADVRKGALKAMNVSYMIKAGGVEAEHVRQILAYDSLKQLLNEVHLYGIPLDMSLGEPTIRFGQKHYRTKTPIFVEPLSNPAQVKSLLLVEPKKAGRTFRQIINGDPSSIQPTPPPSSKPTPIPSRPKQPPVTATFTYTDLTGEPPQFANNNSQRQLELKQLEDKAAAAAEAAAAQRKKLDALMQKKKEETEQKKRELERQQQEEAKRRKLEQEQEQQKERLRKEQEERENQLRQERDQQMAAMHRQVVKSQLCNRWLGELMEQAMLENIRARIQRATKTQRFIQHRTRPWLHRVRERIEKRNAKALERHRLWHFHALISSYNPYINAPVNTARPMHSTPEGIRVRVAQSLQAEAFALDNIKEPSHDTQADIWSSENFALFIYPRIQNKIPMMSEKPRWQLLVHVADVTLDSSHWLSCKFGLDGMSRTERYKAFDITIRMVTMDTSLPSQWVDETGAIVFSLPEAARQQSQEQKKHYWETNKQRLTKLTRDLDRYFPGKRVPFLFTYFPDDSCLEDTLAKIPFYLGLDSNGTVSDYHVLIMNRLTVLERFQDEIHWLSHHTITDRFKEDS